MRPRGIRLLVVRDFPGKTCKILIRARKRQYLWIIFLGLDKRGKSAFNFYRKNVAEKTGSRSHLNTSHVKRRVDFKKFETEEVLSVGDPRNRPTIFGKYKNSRNNPSNDYSSAFTTATEFHPKIPKSQLNMPENIRKHSNLIK